MMILVDKNKRLLSRRLSIALTTAAGNSISEYTVIALFILFIAFAGIQMLSANLNTAMAKVRDDMKTRQQAAQSVLALEQAAATFTGSSSGSATGLSVPQLALLQQSLANKVETTGANGATELLADQIANSAALLLQEGKINTNQYAILMQLANQGHQIAQVEGLLKGAVSNANGDVTQFNNTNISYNGQTYTPVQLSILIGVFNGGPQDYNSNTILEASSGGQDAEPELAAFISLYNQALSSGALSDPIALSTVNSAAVQIASIGESVENTVSLFGMGKSELDASNQNLNEAQQASQINSSTICTTGNFQDNGILCSP